jgi:hypothetical protein
MVEIFCVTLAAIYFAPFMVAAGREHDLTIPILIANVLLGWTGIGWIGVLLFALYSPCADPRKQGRPRLHVV